jgi:serine/threonine protein kinase
MKRIENLIKEGKLAEALEAFEAFINACDGQRDLLMSLSGQMARLQNQVIAADDSATNLEMNKIRLNFQSVILDFRRKILSEYFDMQGRYEFLNSLNDRDTVIEGVLDLRLLPKRYQRDTKWNKREGNSSIIYRVIHPDTKRYAIVLVMKVPDIEPEIKGDIEKITHLKHRNVIKVLDHETDNFPFFIISEYVHGENMAEAIRMVGPRPASQVADWLYQLTDALDYLRHKRILHTNVRPSKIYVDDEWQVMISPFDLLKSGISTYPKSKDNNPQRETPSERTFNRYLDVCQYGSPELFERDGENFPDHDERDILDKMCLSDLYSIGLVGYLLLTGEDLYEGKYLYDIVQNRRKFTDPDSTFRKEKLAKLPNNEIGDIIRRLIVEDPEERRRFCPDLHHFLVMLNPFTHGNKFYDGIPVQQSYRRCLAGNREFISDFYTAFLKETPHHKDFPLIVQKRQLIMLQMAMDVLIDDLNRDKYLQKIMQTPKNGKENVHARYAVADFDQFLQVLVKTVAKNDPQYEEVKDAWAATCAATLEAIRKMK